jgi:hypothetical protein
MVTHQKTQVPSSWLINKAKAQGIVLKKKGSKLTSVCFCRVDDTQPTTKDTIFKVVHNCKVSLTLDLNKLEDFEGFEKDDDLLNGIMLKP